MPLGIERGHGARSSDQLLGAMQDQKCGHGMLHDCHMGHNSGLHICYTKELKQEVTLCLGMPICSPTGMSAPAAWRTHSDLSTKEVGGFMGARVPWPTKTEQSTKAQACVICMHWLLVLLSIMASAGYITAGRIYTVLEQAWATKPSYGVVYQHSCTRCHPWRCRAAMMTLLY